MNPEANHTPQKLGHTGDALFILTAIVGENVVEHNLVFIWRIATSDNHEPNTACPAFTKPAAFQHKCMRVSVARCQHSVTRV